MAPKAERKEMTAPVPVSGRRVALALTVVLAAAFVAASWLAAAAYGLFSTAEGPVAGWILEKEPHKLMRRIMMLLIIFCVPYLLKIAGWGGRGDCGFSRDGGPLPGGELRRDLVVGAVLGLATLGPLVAMSCFAGARRWSPEAAWSALIPMMLTSALAAVAVAVIEETIARGVFFRLLDRLWTLWPAAIVSSLLFAYVHFLKPARAAFESASLWDRTAAVMASALGSPARTAVFELRFVNLALMSIVLCLFVARTRTIWLAVGLHAAWVWVKDTNNALTDRVSGAVAGVGIGARADGTDALYTVVLLLLLGAMAWKMTPRGAVPDG